MKWRCCFVHVPLCTCLFCACSVFVISSAPDWPLSSVFPGFMCPQPAVRRFSPLSWCVNVTAELPTCNTTHVSPFMIKWSCFYSVTLIIQHYRRDKMNQYMEFSFHTLPQKFQDDLTPNHLLQSAWQFTMQASRRTFETFKSLYFGWGAFRPFKVPFWTFKCLYFHIGTFISSILLKKCVLSWFRTEF